MSGTTRTARRPSRSSLSWAGYAAAGWALVFAVRGVYWALGGTAGLGTLSPGIRRAAAEGDPTLFAALWATVAMEVFAAALALALVRPSWRTFPRRLPFLGGREVPGWALLVLAWGAGAVLAGHGALFVGFGVGLAASGGPGALTPEALWYALLWGPWFVLGGVLFMAAGLSYLRGGPPDGRTAGAAASVLGALGGLAATAAPFVVTAIAS